MKKLRVTIEGKVYEVQVEVIDEGSAAAPAPVQPTAARPLETAAQTIPAPTPAAAPVAAKASPAPAAGATDVPSPLSGKIVSIDVKIGQTVDEGAQVATIEAMKMNTYIFAPKAGRIESIFVNAGDGVEEGTVLLRLA